MEAEDIVKLGDGQAPSLGPQGFRRSLLCIARTFSEKWWESYANVVGSQTKMAQMYRKTTEREILVR